MRAVGPDHKQSVADSPGFDHHVAPRVAAVVGNDAPRIVCAYRGCDIVGLAQYCNDPCTMFGLPDRRNVMR